MAIFNSYVSLPEGTQMAISIGMRIHQWIWGSRFFRQSHMDRHSVHNLPPRRIIPQRQAWRLEVGIPKWGNDSEIAVYSPVTIGMYHDVSIIIKIVYIYSTVIDAMDAFSRFRSSQNYSIGFETNIFDLRWVCLKTGYP